MNESIGSIYPMFFMVVFVVIASGYMAFNVNYNKAFKMKNKIIDEINRTDGKSCFAVSGNSKSCYASIVNYASSIGYKPAKLHCAAGYKADPSNKYYCYKQVNFDSTKTKYYYDIYTKIDISIPLVENIWELKVLNVSGSTHTIKPKE